MVCRKRRIEPLSPLHQLLKWRSYPLQWPRLGLLDMYRRRRHQYLPMLLQLLLLRLLHQLLLEMGTSTLDPMVVEALVVVVVDLVVDWEDRTPTMVAGLVDDLVAITTVAADSVVALVATMVVIIKVPTAEMVIMDTTEEMGVAVDRGIGAVSNATIVGSLATPNTGALTVEMPPTVLSVEILAMWRTCALTEPQPQMLPLAMAMGMGLANSLANRLQESLNLLHLMQQLAERLG